MSCITPTSPRPTSLKEAGGHHVGVGCAVTPCAEHVEGDAHTRQLTDVQEGVLGAKLRFRGSPEPPLCFLFPFPPKPPSMCRRHHSSLHMSSSSPGHPGAKRGAEEGMWDPNPCPQADALLRAQPGLGARGALLWGEGMG